MTEGRRMAFDVSRLPILDVSVFLDRADVKRKLNFGVETTGKFVVVIERMAVALDENSIRVEGDETAMITEVTIKRKSGTEDPVQQAANEGLRSELKKLNDSEHELNSELRRAKEERAIFHQALQTQANQQPLDTFANFMARFSEVVQKMDENIGNVTNKLAKAQSKRKDVESELEQMEKNKSRWCVSIVLDVLKAGNVEMVLTYAVFGVCWSPSYTLKVNSTNRTMTVDFIGLITQFTGEDWNQVDLRFISAPFGVQCGQIPTVGLWNVVLLDDKKSAVATSTVSQTPTVPSPTTSNGKKSPQTGDVKSVDVEPETVSCANIHCTYSGVADSIPSGSEECPVFLLSQSLPITLYHECIPRRAQYAFTKAEAVNTTCFPLLPGRFLAYLDNSLATSSSFSHVVYVGERFECSLGIDPAIRVEYKESATAIGGTATAAGFFTKAEMASCKFEQRTMVKNTRRTPVVVKLFDTVPNTADDSVKVTLNEPNADILYKHTTGVVYCKEGGCVIRDLFLLAGKEQEVMTKYTVQHPAGKVLKLTEKV